MDPQKVIKTVLTATMMLSFLTVYAQKQHYPYLLEGDVIVCRDNDDGISRSRINPNRTHTGTDYDNLGDGIKMAAKFKVAKSCATYGDGAKKMFYMTWYLATGTVHKTENPDGYDACALYYESEDKSDLGTWRCPTACEGMLIAMYNEQMEHTTTWDIPMGGAVTKSDALWTCTKHINGDNYTWVWTWHPQVSFAGAAVKAEKSEVIRRVRCVRDL